MRPGSAAFPSSPIAKAEKTRLYGGSGGSSAWTIVSCHASERATTESRLSTRAKTIHAQLTKSNAW